MQVGSKHSRVTQAVVETGLTNRFMGKNGDVSVPGCDIREFPSTVLIVWGEFPRFRSGVQRGFRGPAVLPRKGHSVAPSSPCQEDAAAGPEGTPAQGRVVGW